MNNKKIEEKAITIRKSKRRRSESKFTFYTLQAGYLQINGKGYLRVLENIPYEFRDMKSTEEDFFKIKQHFYK